MKLKQKGSRNVRMVLAVTIALVGCLGDSPDQMLASAKSHLQKRESKAATIQLKNALQKEPSLAEARALLAGLLLEEGDLNGAEIQLSKATELSYPAEKLAPTRARLLLAQGKPKQLVSELASTRLPEPVADADLRVSVASAYAAMQRHAEARSALNDGLSHAPSDARAQLLDIRLLATEGRIDEAQAALDKILASEASSSEAWQLKADLLREKGGQVADALRNYRKAIELDNRNAQAHIRAVDLLLSQNMLDEAEKQLEGFSVSNPGNLHVRFQRAVLALQKSNLTTAKEHVQLLLKAAPDSPQVLLLAGLIEYRRNAWIGAETHLGKALAITPGMEPARTLLARTYLRLGDGAKALATLKPSLAAKLPRAQVLVVAGEAYLLQGEAAKAEELFTTAARLDPSDRHARMALAMTQIASGDDSRGLGSLTEMAAEDVGPVANLAIISTHIRQGKTDLALKAIAELDRKMPDKAIALNLRGRIYLASKNPASAREAFELALKREPLYFPAVASLAAIDLSEGRKAEQAIARFDPILKADPKHLSARMAVLQLRAGAGQSLAKEVETVSSIIQDFPQAIAPRIALVRIQLSRKEPKLALAAAQEAVAVAPDSGEALQVLAEAQLANNDVNQAVVAYNRWAALLPGQAAPQMRLAELHLANNDVELATQSFRRALSIRPDLLDAQRALVVISLQKKDFAEAMRLARQIQAQAGNAVAGFVVEGDIEAMRKNWPQASRAYLRAMEVGPAPQIAIKHHQALLAARTVAEADRFSAEWLAKHPKDATFLAHLGNVAMSLNRYEEAYRRYENVLRQEPGSAMAANNLAWLRLRLNKPDALEAAQLANKLQPNNPVYMDTLAEAFTAAGRYDEAMALQRNAVQLAPDAHDLRLHLAKLLIATGKKNEAKKELSQLEALGPRYRSHADVRKLQASL